jgi:hypothetical protein
MVTLLDTLFFYITCNLIHDYAVLVVQFSCFSLLTPRFLLLLPFTLRSSFQRDY